MFDGAAIGQEFSELVRDFLGRSLAPVLERIAALEGRPLLPGPPGEPGRDGIDGKNGEGAPGRDGIGVVGTVIDRSGALVMTMSDGEIRDLGPVVGRDGVAGRDGVDGLSIDDMTLAYDGERSLVVGFVRGEVKREWTLQLPIPIYRGVYQVERAYTRGDIVTFGGSSWQCNKDTTEKPGDIAADWTLSVKRGRDGRSNGK